MRGTNVDNLDFIYLFIYIYFYLFNHFHHMVRSTQQSEAPI